MNAYVYLEDGTRLMGKAFGANKTVIGELVFNTGMTGYQEVLTDPSYREQIVVMTYPLIGNYGINEDDFESSKVQVKAFVVREYSKASHYKGAKSIEEFLIERDIPGVYDIDTRMITKKIRDKGSMKCLITTEQIENSRELLSKYQFPKDVVKWVSRRQKETIEGNEVKIGILDLGLKRGIVENLKSCGCSIVIYPYDTSKGEILEDRLDALLLSNGPGDPKDSQSAVKLARELTGELPLWGICLGHQILALSLGANTYKMKFGHRGSNHPVINTQLNKIMITSQNHGYAVDDKSLAPNMVKTYVNVNDGTVEGFECPEYNIKAVQFHPEEGPGPLDGREIFKCWVDSIKGR